MNDQPSVEKRVMHTAEIVRFGQWAIAIVAVLATLGIVVMFGQRQRIFEPWSLGDPIGEIVRLQAGQSVSQTIEIPGGGVGGFSAVVRAFPHDANPVAINLRVRRSGATREILRESVVAVSEGGHSTISTGQFSPVAAGSVGKLDFEIEVAGTSQGELAILASRTKNIGPRLLTINGAPTDSELRAEITPILSVGPVGMLRMTSISGMARVAGYVLALWLLSVVAAGLVMRTFKKLFEVDPPRLIDGPTVVLGVLLLTLAIVQATGTMVVGDSQMYLDEIRDGFWRAAFAFPLLALLVGSFTILLPTLGRKVVAQTWNGRAELRQIWQSARAHPSRFLGRPIHQWRVMVRSALWLIVLALVLDLWSVDGLTQMVASIAEILMGVAVLSAMLASSGGRLAASGAGVNQRAIVVSGVVVSVGIFALVLFFVTTVIDDSVVILIQRLVDRLSSRG
ncbi:MAG: hypothetical protein CL790_04960 [Chloroflexi bacterium]|nr:hypothetical protein [Chloroflexota bacterium]HCU73482.1 hypothetical protein [Chloroflexota bacterium]|tara:strand:- start:12309 stop:13664 length:1356 start_codon:yes stop_codon:yes gene_type:complete